MKTLALAAGLALAVAAPALADPVEGVWQTKPDDHHEFGYVKIAPCGVMFCGKLVKSFGADGKPKKSVNIGKNIVWNMTAKGNGRYGGGKIWAPDRNKIYKSYMVLKGTSLKVNGCVFGGLFCRGQVWTRVK